MADRRGKDTWSIFKIMGEFVEGFETLHSLWPAAYRVTKMETTARRS